MSNTPLWLGPACGLASAVLYTLTNIALRQCVDIDPYLVSAVKAAPTVVVLGPLLCCSRRSQRSVTAVERPPRQRTAIRLSRFIGASFLAQFFGNAAFQKALGFIGLAASVPITLGVLIVGGAIFGAILLGEAVSGRKIVAMITLIVAVVVLSLPEPGTTGTTADHSAAEILTGSLWAALSGLAYSLFGVTMRMTLQHGFRSNVLMFVSGLTGTITLWSYCAVTLGWEAIVRTAPEQWLAMTAAGFLNFSAFVAITASLRLLPVVAVNLINASQVAMAAVAGVILFSEPITARLGVGIGLTFIGLIILTRRTRAPLVITD